jgi:hypothetical protein
MLTKGLVTRRPRRQWSAITHRQPLVGDFPAGRARVRRAVMAELDRNSSHSP